MEILALDTATAGCSVALWRDGAIAAWRFQEMARGQSEALLPMVKDVLNEAGTTAAGVDLIAVTRGPGAFTGLRIGLSTARALALAAGVPCLGVDTTDVIARGVPADQITGELLVVLDTKRSDFYAQKFSDHHQPLTLPQALPRDDLAGWLQDPDSETPVLVAGDVAGEAVQVLADAGIRSQLADAPGLPDARYLAEIAVERWQPGQLLDPPGPLYLRPPDAKLPRDGGRLRP